MKQLTIILSVVALAVAMFAVPSVEPGNKGRARVTASGLPWPGVGNHQGFECVVPLGLCEMSFARCVQKLLVDNNGNGLPDIGDAISCEDSL